MVLRTIVLVCSLTSLHVAGVQSDDVKRHAVSNTLADMNRRQEQMMSTLQKVVIENMAEIKNDIGSAGHRIEQQVQTVKLDLENTFGGMEKEVQKQSVLLDSRVGEIHKNITQICDVSLEKELKSVFPKLDTGHKTLTNTVTDSNKKIETLQTVVSKLSVAVKEFKENQQGGIVQQTTATPSRTTRRVYTHPPLLVTLRPTTTIKPTVTRTCRSGYIGNTYGCYYLGRDYVSWNAARTRCKKDGGDHVSLGSSGELEALGVLMRQQGASAKYYWLGARKVASTWRWSGSDSRAYYTNWMSGYPISTFACSYMRNYYGSSLHLKWYNTACLNIGSSITYICEA